MHHKKQNAVLKTGQCSAFLFIAWDFLHLCDWKINGEKRIRKTAGRMAVFLMYIGKEIRKSVLRAFLKQNLQPK